MQRASRYRGDGPDHPDKGGSAGAGQPAVPQDEEDPVPRGPQRPGPRGGGGGGGNTDARTHKHMYTHTHTHALEV